MNKKIYFSKQDKGWFEYEIPDHLKHSTNDELINWAHQKVDQHHFKGFVISENPNFKPCGCN